MGITFGEDLISWRYSIITTPLSCGIATLLLCLITVLLRNHNRLSTAILLLTSFMAGCFLITNSKGNDDTSVMNHAFIQTIENRMVNGREAVSDIIMRHGVKGDEHSVVTAMTLGERQRVSKDLRKTYYASGAAHVFALSGMHLGILFMLISMFLPTTFHPRISTIVQLSTLWMYVFLVGLHPSILRAAVMLSIYSICRLSSRNPDNVSVLTITALLLITIRPQWVFDIGFQMSFMAVLSIIIYYRRFMDMAGVHNRILHYIVGVMMLSLSATIGVTPLIAHYFGRISVYSLLTNIIISPCAVLIIALTILLLLFSGIAFLLSLVSSTHAITYIPDALCHITGWTLSLIVRTMNNYLEHIVALPYCVIDHIRVNSIQTLLIYIIICCITLLCSLFFPSTKSDSVR